MEDAGVQALADHSKLTLWSRLFNGVVAGEGDLRTGK
jgi:hypothetical protein